MLLVKEMVPALIIIAPLVIFDIVVVWACIKADSVTVHHGEWIKECQNRCRCSRCGLGRNTETQLGWNFCPNCGAKMEANENGR